MNEISSLTTFNPELAARWGVYGHDWALRYLEQGLRHDRIRQAYLITGTESLGKTTLAQAFATRLNCQHPDPHQRPCGSCESCRKMPDLNALEARRHEARKGEVVGHSHPDLRIAAVDNESKLFKGALKIDALRDIMQWVPLQPYLARYRIAIIQDIHRAYDRSQDALLKTLEEPPPYVILILTAPSTEGIMPTIISRCQVIPLRPAPSATIEATLKTHFNAHPDDAQLLARLSGGRIGWAIHALQNPNVQQQRQQSLDLLESLLHQSRAQRFDAAADLAKSKRDELVPLLALWLSYWRDLLLAAESGGLRGAVKACNVDRLPSLERALLNLDTPTLLKALRATQHMIDLLYSGANVQLALEAMLLRYPRLR